MRERVVWCAPQRERKSAWWYLLVPVNAYRGRIGGKATLDICLGFVWSGHATIRLGGGR